MWELSKAYKICEHGNLSAKASYVPVRKSFFLISREEEGRKEWRGKRQ